MRHSSILPLAARTLVLPQLDLLRQCWNLSGMTTAACKFGVANNLISRQKYDQILQWEAELNRVKS